MLILDASAVNDRVKETVESAKASLRDAAEAVEPKTAEEAIQVNPSLRCLCRHGVDVSYHPDYQMCDGLHYLDVC